MSNPTVADILATKDIILASKRKKAAIYTLFDGIPMPIERQGELRQLDDRIHSLTRSLADMVLACDDIKVKS